MRDRWRSTSPISSSDAPLRSMSVARLWRSRCEPTYFCGCFRPVLSKAASSTVFTVWASLNGGWCGVFAERNSARVALTSVSDVLDDCFAPIRGKRHAIVQLALAADEALARAPIDVIKPDRDDLGSAKPEPCHQQHRVVAQPDGVIGSDRVDQLLDLFGLEISRQGVGVAGDTRQTVGERDCAWSCLSRTGT